MQMYKESKTWNSKGTAKDVGVIIQRVKSYGYSLEDRKKAIKYYLEGIGFRKIERLLAISNVTVLYWVRELGRKLSLEKICNKKVEMLELDELGTYVKIDIGCRLQLREIPKRYWVHMSETVQD